MSAYVTQRAKDALLKSRRGLECELSRVRESMNIGGETGDGWHDEGYKTGVGDEQRIDSQLALNSQQISQCRVITPEEQADCVKIGNIVTVKYLKDGLEMTFVVDGIPSYNDVCSSGSPLGIGLMGKKRGEIFKITDTDIEVEVLKIFPPSYYETFVKQKKSSQ